MKVRRRGQQAGDSWTCAEPNILKALNPVLELEHPFIKADNFKLRV